MLRSIGSELQHVTATSVMKALITGKLVRDGMCIHHAWCDAMTGQAG